MSRAKSTTHGRAVDAPSEQGFVPGSPDKAPPRNEKRAPANAAIPSGRSFWQASLAALKLLSGILLVLAASSAVAWGAYRYALTTPRFAVRTLEIAGARRLTEQDVRKLSGIEVGRNIFGIDTEDAERRLLVDPWVKDVKITRRLPATLSIVLTEREAIAAAALSGQLYLVTKTGEPFKRLEPGDPYDLPVITGISAEGIASDRALELERIATAIEVLRTYESLPMSRVHVAQEVNFNEEGAAALTVGNSGMTLELGTGPWRKKLLMAGRVLEQVGRKGQNAGIVFLDNQAHPERVVVRLR